MKTFRSGASACGSVRVFGGVPKEVLFDNAKPVILERDTYGAGQHRWHAGMLEFSRDFGFQLRVCRPYRAKTKGKVERFNGYLKGSFLVPLVGHPQGRRIEAGCPGANREVLRWLPEVANVRIHATTGERPSARLPADQAHLSALPVMALQAHTAAVRTAQVIPVESLQHPLSVYDSLLEVAA